jgi:hypothetical protein
LDFVSNIGASKLEKDIQERVLKSRVDIGNLSTKRNTLTKNVIKVKLRRGDILLRYRDGIRRLIYLLLVAGL